LSASLVDADDNTAQSFAFLLGRDPVAGFTGKGIQLLTGPFQMMWIEIDGGIAATFWAGRRGSERPEKLNE